MKTQRNRFGIVLTTAALFAGAIPAWVPVRAAESAAAAAGPPRAAGAPAAFDSGQAEIEVETRYRKAHPEIQEYVLWTARSFGPSGLWRPEDAYADWSADARERKVKHLAAVLGEGEYGRHLCAALADASALKDKRLIPGLMKVAGYHQPDRDYDCRPKWMAVAALARQETDEAVPLLVSLVDHGNQNTRNWARAALARRTGQDFLQDKRAWARWWREQGHEPIAESFLRPYEPATKNKK